MSKQITVLMPCVPNEFITSLKRVTPPYLKDFASFRAAEGISDLELTFDVPAVETEKEFNISVRATMLMALIIFYEAYPQLITRTISHLLTVDDKWKKWRADEVQAYPKDWDQRLVKRFIHELVVQGGDLIGIDHRPCWDSGKCTHEDA